MSWPHAGFVVVLPSDGVVLPIRNAGSGERPRALCCETCGAPSGQHIHFKVDYHHERETKALCRLCYYIGELRQLQVDTMMAHKYKVIMTMCEGALGAANAQEVRAFGDGRAWGGNLFEDGALIAFENPRMPVPHGWIGG